MYIVYVHLFVIARVQTGGQEVLLDILLSVKAINRERIWPFPGRGLGFGSTGFTKPPSRLVAIGTFFFLFLVLTLYAVRPPPCGFLLFIQKI